MAPHEDADFFTSCVADHFVTIFFFRVNNTQRNRERGREWKRRVYQWKRPFRSIFPLKGRPDKVGENSMHQCDCKA